MKLEKKAIIVGAIWGLIGIIKFSPSNNPFARIFGGQNAPISKLITEILGIPITISSFLIPESGHGTIMALPLALIMVILSILIGALIGYGVAKVYLKSRE